MRTAQSVIFEILPAESSWHVPPIEPALILWVKLILYFICNIWIKKASLTNNLVLLPNFSSMSTPICLPSIDSSFLPRSLCRGYFDIDHVLSSCIRVPRWLLSTLCMVSFVLRRSLLSPFTLLFRLLSSLNRCCLFLHHRFFSSLINGLGMLDVWFLESCDVLFRTSLAYTSIDGQSARLRGVVSAFDSFDRGRSEWGWSWFRWLVFWYRLGGLVHNALQIKFFLFLLISYYYR